MHLEVLVVDILKFTKKVLQKNFTYVATKTKCFGKSVLLAACIFQTIIVIAVIKIPSPPAPFL